MKPAILFFLHCILFTAIGFAQLPYQIQKQVEVQNAAVVSAHPLASKAGLDILKQGGNAVDAAIATQLALAEIGRAHV